MAGEDDAAFAPTTTGDAFETSDQTQDGATEAPPEDSTEAASETKPGPASTEQVGAPETYADFTLPQGTEPDTEVMTALTARFRENGLSQTQAQLVIDLLGEAQNNSVKTAETFWEEKGGEWEQAARTQGLMRGEVLAQAQAGLAALDSDGTLNSLLKETNMARHPAIIAAFSAYGKARMDDGIHVGTDVGGVGQRRPTHEILYDGK